MTAVAWLRKAADRGWAEAEDTLGRLYAQGRGTPRDDQEAVELFRAASSTTAASSLGEMLGLGEVDEDELYDALDWLLERQPAIETALAKRHLTNGTLVLYDVSSSYMEGRCCPLAQRGYSRDGKKRTLQIIYGLLCAPDGSTLGLRLTGGPLFSTAISRVLRRIGTLLYRRRRAVMEVRAVSLLVLHRSRASCQPAGSLFSPQAAAMMVWTAPFFRPIRSRPPGLTKATNQSRRLRFKPAPGGNGISALAWSVNTTGVAPPDGLETWQSQPSIAAV
jgi:hypothetical protein